MNICFLSTTNEVWTKVMGVLPFDVHPRPFELRKGRTLTVDGVECGPDDVPERMRDSTQEFTKITLRDKTLLDHAWIVAEFDMVDRVKALYHGPKATYVCVTDAYEFPESFMDLMGSLSHSKSPGFQRVSAVYTGEQHTWDAETWPVMLGNQYAEAMTTKFDRRHGVLPNNWNNQAVWVDDDEKFGAWLRNIMRPVAPATLKLVREPRSKDLDRMMASVRSMATRVKLGQLPFKTLSSYETAHLVNLSFYAGNKAYLLFWEIDVPGLFADVGVWCSDVDQFLERVTSELGERITRHVQVPTEDHPEPKPQASQALPEPQVSDEPRVKRHRVWDQ